MDLSIALSDSIQRCFLEKMFPKVIKKCLLSEFVPKLAKATVESIDILREEDFNVQEFTFHFPDINVETLEDAFVLLFTKIIEGKINVDEINNDPYDEEHQSVEEPVENPQQEPPKKEAPKKKEAAKEEGSKRRKKKEAPKKKSPKPKALWIDYEEIIELEDRTTNNTGVLLLEIEEQRKENFAEHYCPQSTKIADRLTTRTNGFLIALKRNLNRLKVFQER